MWRLTLLQRILKVGTADGLQEVPTPTGRMVRPRKPESVLREAGFTAGLPADSIPPATAEDKNPGCRVLALIFPLCNDHWLNSLFFGIQRGNTTEGTFNILWMEGLHGSMWAMHPHQRIAGGKTGTMKTASTISQVSQIRGMAGPALRSQAPEGVWVAMEADNGERQFAV